MLRGAAENNKTTRRGGSQRKEIGSRHCRALCCRMSKNRLRAIPLGGAGEVGRNCWVLEYGDDAIILDMGVMFPESEMLGVDLILPDITYLQERKANIHGVFLTHGHEDHIGALPFLLPMLGFPPIYGTSSPWAWSAASSRSISLLDKVERTRSRPARKVSPPARSRSSRSISRTRSRTPSPSASPRRPAWRSTLPTGSSTIRRSITGRPMSPRWPSWARATRWC